MNDWLVELISTLPLPDQCRIIPWKTLSLALENERKLIVTCFRMTATFNFAYYLNCSTVTIWNSSDRESGPVFSYKLRYIAGFWLVEMAISTNQKPAIYRNLYENTAPAWSNCIKTTSKMCRPIIICSKKCSLKNHIINVDESDYKPISTMHISPLCQQSL